MSILVTGATGRIGAETVRLLIERGHPVRALVHTPGKRNRVEGADVVIGDFENPASLDAAVRNVQRVFLIARFTPDILAHERHVIDACRRHVVEHVVYLSAIGAAMDWPLPSGRLHWEGEHQLERSGLPFTHLRPNYFMQELLGFAESIAASGAFGVPAGAGAVSMIDTRDIAAFAASVLAEGTHVGQTYTLTGPAAVSFADVAEALTVATGKQVTYRDVSLEEAKQAAIAAGLTETHAEVRASSYARYRDPTFAAGPVSQVTSHVFDVTGSPARTIHQFAVDHAAWFTGARAT